MKISELYNRTLKKNVMISYGPEEERFFNNREKNYNFYENERYGSIYEEHTNNSNNSNNRNRIRREYEGLENQFHREMNMGKWGGKRHTRRRAKK